MSLTEDEKNKLFAILKEHGDAKVREDLAAGIYGPKKKPYVESWLSDKTITQEQSTVKTRLKFAEEANEIAKEANQIARSSKRAAWWAILISVIAFVVAIFK